MNTFLIKYAQCMRMKTRDTLICISLRPKAAQTIFRVVAHRKQRVKCLAHSEESMNVCVFKCGEEREMRETARKGDV